MKGGRKRGLEESMFGRKKWLYFVLLFLVLPIGAFCVSPRLLITLGPKCDFSPKALQKEVKCLVISSPRERLAQDILELDRSQPIHIVVYTGRLENIESFAWEIGYEYIVLNGSLKKSLKRLRRRISTIPCIDSALPRTDPHSVGCFYDLFMKVDRLFKERGLPYWAISGTLLGAVRHGGMIPWDDDIDIAICAENVPLLEELKGVLAERGLELYHYSEAEFYKIFPADGTPCPKKGGGFYPWKYPFVDVFPLILIDGTRTYMYEAWRDSSPNDFFYPNDLSFPPSELPFGPTTIPAPAGYLDYVRRAYGEDWDRVAYLYFDHRNERWWKKIRVDLIDRSPPPYILPEQIER